MKFAVVLLICVMLSACMVPPQSSTIQLLPYSETGVRAGCIRTLARLAIRSQTAALWSPDDAAIFCDEIERSYYRELHAKTWQRA